MNIVIPKIFISYSHDSQDHKKWILDFATRLRNNGVDASLDLWNLNAGDDLPHFMEKNLDNSNFIIMVCTDRYVQKANNLEGGVGYEKMIITSNILDKIDSNKVIPIIRQNGSHDLPIFMRSKKYIDFSNEDEFEICFEELIRTIHNAPLFQIPEIGNNPFLQKEETPPILRKDILLELMKCVVNDYEHDQDFSKENDLRYFLEISRISFDFLMKRAVDEELLIKNVYGQIFITEKGKEYALKNKLI